MVQYVDWDAVNQQRYGSLLRGSGGGGYGGMGGGDNFGDFDWDFDFDVGGGIENVPAQGVDFDKEAYYQSMVAPAERARKDATLEAIQQQQAIAAHTGRPAGDVVSEIQQESIKSAGDISARATQQAEEMGFKYDTLEQQDLSRRTQAAIAQGQLRSQVWGIKANLFTQVKMLRMKHAHESALLTRQIGAQAAQAEMARRTAYDVEMLKIGAGMEMLKFKEESANLRSAANLAMSERETERLQAYRMEYLDRMSKIQSMDTIRKWMDAFGRRAQLTQREQDNPMMGTGISDAPQMDYGQNWWEDWDTYGGMTGLYPTEEYEYGWP